MQHTCKLKLATRAWPLHLALKQIEFTHLHQCQHGVHVDLVGRLVLTLGVDPTGPSNNMKHMFTFNDGTCEQDLELFRDQSSFDAQIWDVLVIKGGVLKSYNGCRCVQTGYLTYMRTNPPDMKDDIPSI